MNSGTIDVEAAAVLTAVRRFRRDANAAEANVLQIAIEWAQLHQVSEVEEAATWWAGRGQDTGIPIAGPGAPLVSEFAVAEFATALGLSAGSGRVLVAHALELACRLPRIWARVQSGSLAPWRARRIAEETRSQSLSVQAAAYVDQMVAPFAHRVGVAQTQRTVEEAITRFMPEYAAERRAQAAEGRYFTIDHDQVSFAGTSRIHGELDLADALDLEDAVAAGATQLAALGSEDSLDVRRAAAVGMIARGEQPLVFEHPGASTTGVPTGSTTSRNRQVVLYVHLSDDAVRCGDPNTPVRIENAGGQLLTADQIAEWCRRDDTSRVIVKPVIDPQPACRRRCLQGSRLARRTDPAARQQLCPSLLQPARPVLRHRPHRPLRRGRATRSDQHRQPRRPVQVAPPDEDPRRLDLHDARTRRLPLDQPPRPHLPPRPHRHHRPHPTTSPGTRRPTPSTNQLTPTPPDHGPGGAIGMPSAAVRLEGESPPSRSRRADLSDDGYSKLCWWNASFQSSPRRTKVLLMIAENGSWPSRCATTEYTTTPHSGPSGITRGSSIWKRDHGWAAAIALSASSRSMTPKGNAISASSVRCSR
jgi:hypothetical protein